jgi:hypothetical protein
MMNHGSKPEAVEDDKWAAVASKIAADLDDEANLPKKANSGKPTNGQLKSRVAQTAASGNGRRPLGRTRIAEVVWILRACRSGQT